MDEKLNISLKSPSQLNLSMTNRSALGVTVQSGQGGTRDYNRLNNRPQINGITLAGDQTFVDLGLVSENTAGGWNSMPQYVPRHGEICLYNDTGQIKIGDGSTPIADLPFIGEADIQTVREELKKHADDTTAHVTEEERAFWNAKLNYDVNGEELVFTRL